MARRAAMVAWTLLMPLLLWGCASGGGLECAPYARMVSGIQLRGDAAAWWEEAAGRYPRASQPVSGSVLVFRRSERLPAGHVSTVTAVRSARSIVVADANWVHGEVTKEEPILDVSPGNDWTAVRVWWAPSRQFGITTYPTFGFIRPAGTAQPMW